MKSVTALGSAARLALAGMLMGAISARAGDSDEVLKLERMANQEMLVPETTGAEVATSVDRTTPAASESGSSILTQLHQKDVELERARNEVARLKRALVEQQARHDEELQRSYYNMGCVYKAAKQFERAESEFLKVLAISPNDAGVHYNLAILYDDDLHQKTKAREHYQKFLELAPDDKDVPQVKEWLAELDQQP